jgi:hypothetical protein
MSILFVISTKNACWISDEKNHWKLSVVNPQNSHYAFHARMEHFNPAGPCVGQQEYFVITVLKT